MNPVNMPHPVIAQLARQRVAWGLSREWLADRAECAANTLAAIECGRQSPNMQLLERLADALGYEIALKPKREF